MDPQQILIRLRDDDDRWDGLEYRPPAKQHRPQPAQWRRLTISVIAGLAVGAIAAVTIVGLRDSQVVAPSVSTSSPAAEPTPTPTISWEQPSDPLPGSAIVTPLSTPLTQTLRGTRTVHLGARPSGSTGISYTFTCLTAGDFRFPGGSGESCSDADVNGVQTAQPISDVYKLKPGIDTVTVTTTDDARWTIVTTWVESHLSPLSVNASGQTYGTAATGLHPTLISTYASNGRLGYSYAKDHRGYNSGCAITDPVKYEECQEAFAKTIPPIKVYLSDGKTLIGEMRTDGGTHVEYVSTPTPTSTP